MRKLILFLIICFILSVSSVLAENMTGLDLYKLNVKVGSATDSDVENDTTISKNAKPSDTIEFEVELENLFDSDENCDDDNDNDKNECDIEDITIEITIKDIDHGDDLKKKTAKFEISEGNKKTQTLLFEIPEIVEDGTYDVIIIINGDNTGNSSSYEIEWNLKLKVEKKDRDIQITNYELTPAILSCGDSQTDLKIEIYNYGSKTDDEVVIEVKGPDLNIREKVVDIELGKDYDKDAKYETDIPITINDEFLVKGIYPVTINVYYNTDELIDQEIINLDIDGCIAEEPVEDTINETITENLTEEETTEEDETIDLITIPLIEEDSKQPSYLIPIVGLFMIIGIIIIIVLIIILKK